MCARHRDRQEIRDPHIDNEALPDWWLFRSLEPMREGIAAKLLAAKVDQRGFRFFQSDQNPLFVGAKRTTPQYQMKKLGITRAG
jgi:hypothetical protein